MKRIYNIVFLLFGFLIGSLSAYGQATLISVPYAYGFEEDEELDNWVLLNTNEAGDMECEDQWVVGNGARSEGTKGLYISNDGYTPQFSVKPNVSVAYRDFEVPADPTGGSVPYEISFDWMSNGQQGVSDLYVCVLAPDRENVPLADPSSAKKPSIIADKRLAPYNNSESRWKNASFIERLPDGQVFRLAFIWVNVNTDSIKMDVGACIDNIQIVPSKYPKPTDLKVDASSNCDTTWVSWQGAYYQYELEYKLRQKDSWNQLKVGTNRTYLTHLEEGAYDFRVRAVDNEGNRSGWLTATNIVVYCADKHCINYADLKSGATFYGNYQNPEAYLGLVDYGADNKMSRHTVNWVQGEFDPRTGNKLPIIPPGEIASVRLGNWNNGRQAERIKYTYIVGDEPTILLVRYAIVLEDPGHEGEPRFTLNVFGEDGYPIGEEGYACGEADFRATEELLQDANSGWHKYGSNYWKEWTAVGLDLSGRKPGEELTVELTTYDCDMSAHFGYAYFTLDCLSASIETNSCGEDEEIKVKAPDGFAYLWTNPTGHGNQWYDEAQEITIQKGDTTTYYCEVSFLEEMECSFTLSTKAYPRFPVAQFSHASVAENCENKIRFTNESFIRMEYEDGVEDTTQPCEAYSWEFVGSRSGKIYSTQANPEVKFSNEGETVQVFLKAYLSSSSREEGCMDEASLTINVEPIGEKKEQMTDSICKNTPYQGAFGKGSGQTIYGGTEGVRKYCDTVPSLLTGCDSITTLELTVLPIYDVKLDTTICFGDSFEFAGKFYDRDTTVVKNLAELTECGCDSIVTLKLHVRDEITFDAVPTDVLEGPNTGKITLENVSLGNNYTYSLDGKMNAPLTGLAGGVYTVLVYSEFGCVSAPVEVKVFQDSLEVMMGDVPEVCADESYFEVPYTLGKGFPTTYDILFDSEAKAAGFADVLDLPADETPIQVSLPQEVRPNTYHMNILFEDLLGEDIPHLMAFTVKYPASILKQKWNDVLGVFNASYNGGYDFSAFQWYKNGELLEGESGAYLYTKGEILDSQAEYTVLLTRSDDSIAVLTCPFVPELRLEDVGLYPTVVQTHAPVMLNVAFPAIVSVYDGMGVKQKEVRVDAGMGQQLYISEKAGYYLVHIQLEDGRDYPFKVMVK